MRIVKKLDLKKNYIYIVTLVMVVVIVTINIRASLTFSGFADDLIDEKLDANINSLEFRFEESRNNTRAAAVSMSRYPAAVEAIREQNREEIIRIFTDSYGLYNVNFYTVTDANGNVLARTHSPEQYGDFVANQQNIADALDGKVSSYFEEGTIVKVSVRTGAPVYDENGIIIGVISAGVRFDTDETVDRLSRLLGTDVTVFWGDTRIATTVLSEGHRVTDTQLEAGIMETLAELQEGEEHRVESEVFGNYYRSIYRPLFNSHGDIFAILVLGVPVDELRNESNMLLLEVVLIGVMCIVIYIVMVRALRRAEEANKAKSTFLSTMSHEIRTPINAILGITEMLLQSSDIHPEARVALDKLHTSGDMLLGIINDILDVSKIEAGKLDLIPIEYETASLISDTAQLNMMRIGSKPIKFELHVGENVPARVYGDELRVKQILNNLLSNAFKYTSEGKVTLMVTTKQDMPASRRQGTVLERIGEWQMENPYQEPAEEGHEIGVTLVFCVIDTGQGMSEEQVAKLGQEYSRFNPEANRTTEGTGLGMNITKNLVHMMGGDMLVKSEKGKGSAFTVYIPQGKVGDEVLGRELVENLHRFRTSSRAQMKRTQITRDPMPYGSIMVVDDVETNIYVARGLLAPYKLQIDSAQSGAEAIEILGSGKVYDIIFMDHMMPGMDGIEATRLIREMGYTAPIVALTANAVSGQAEVFLAHGFDDFISKPIDMRQMNTVLNRLIRDKQSPQVIKAAREAPPADVNPRILEAFVRDSTKALAVLEKVIDSGGVYDEDLLNMYTVQVHGLKAVLAIIGEKELSEAARELEALGKEKDSMNIAEKTPEFAESLRKLVDRYR